MEFIVGGYGEFDRLAAKVLRVAKDNHPQITLSLLLPYHPSERPIKKPEGFDATVYPPGMETSPAGWRLYEPTAMLSTMSISCLLTHGTQEAAHKN